MKKTISFLLVFCLFAFSLFSTGCGSSSGGSSSGGSNIGGFKFHGAVVDIDVVAGLDGATNSARLSPNVRGAIAISARDTIVKVYELNPLDPELRGAAISDIKATFANNKLTCNTKENPLGVGDYLFEVYNIDSDKVFLRAILHVDGTSNEVSLEISPVTEIKTAVYKEWVAKAPDVNSVKNFELNLTAALETAMKTKAVTYAETLATWDQAADIVETVPVSDINVPIETKVPVEDDLIASFPVDLQNATWRAIAANDIDGKQFVKRYMFDTDKKWIKFTNTDTDKLPFIMFSEYEYDSDHLMSGYYRMGEYFYTEETMDAWEPNENNEFEIPDDAIGEYSHSFYKVLSDSKVEVIHVVDGTLVYDARITVYNGKTYLHIRNMDEIYELIP